MKFVCVFTGDIAVTLVSSVPRSGAYLGQPVKLTCRVTLIGPVEDVPLITWTLEQPELANYTSYSPRERVFVSELLIDFFDMAHEGTYSCVASVNSLPYTVDRSTTIVLDPNCMFYIAV